jgi:hypothetical protein
LDNAHIGRKSSRHFISRSGCWLARRKNCSGFGLIGDIAVGIVGALIGSWLMPRLGIRIASGIVSANYRRHDRRSASAGHSKTRDGRLSAAALVAIVGAEMAAGWRTGLWNSVDSCRKSHIL